MAKVRFYEKPGCMNNTRQKALLQAAGHELEVFNLLTTPWTAESLRPFFGDKPVTEWFNRAAPKIKQGEILPERFNESSALAAMVAEPLLIRRPLLEAEGRKVSGFDATAIAAWIGLAEDGKPVQENCPRDDNRECPAP